MKQWLLVGVVLVGVCLLVAVAVGGIRGKKFAQETARGNYAIAVAGGNVGHPRAIYMRVKSRPHQRASGGWTVVCSKGLGAGSKRGSLSGHTPLVHKLRMPYKRPSSCTASASAQLSRGGFVKVQLFATR